ncbi:hypothetical protein B0J18DRAFT_417443 [Chaetomium sp. MPI-SDFR-AT-0129]|nr:hypothetical protein B0J18DRAFT_417443 [Chaetomium sp. MPI-SDFR-AT-0129]
MLLGASWLFGYNSCVLSWSHMSSWSLIGTTHGYHETFSVLFREPQINLKPRLVVLLQTNWHQSLRASIISLEREIGRCSILAWEHDGYLPTFSGEILGHSGVQLP